MKNNTLIEKLSNIQVAYTDPILAAAATRLHKGDDAEEVVVEALDKLASAYKQLQAMRVEEAVAQGLPVQAPVRLAFPRGPQGFPSSAVIDAKFKEAQGGAPVDKNTPRRWMKDGAYGCYFPGTDLNVGQMGGRGTGAPSDVTWVDSIEDLSWVGVKGRLLKDVFAEEETKKSEQSPR